MVVWYIGKSYDSPYFVSPRTISLWTISPKAQFPVNTFPLMSLLRVWFPRISFLRATFPEFEILNEGNVARGNEIRGYVTRGYEIRGNLTRGNEISGKCSSGKCNSRKHGYGELCFRWNGPGGIGPQGNDNTGKRTRSIHRLRILDVVRKNILLRIKKAKTWKMFESKAHQFFSTIPSPLWTSYSNFSLTKYLYIFFSCFHRWRQRTCIFMERNRTTRSWYGRSLAQRWRRRSMCGLSCAVRFVNTSKNCSSTYLCPVFLHSFTLYERKHHCRNCGGVFCNKCSRFESEISRLRILKPVRVCQTCYSSLRQNSLDS
jgi:hypothetical protein